MCPPFTGRWGASGFQRRRACFIAVRPLLFATAVNSQDRTTPLYQACLGGHFEIAKALLEAGADGAAGVGRLRSTPLHLACRRGHTALIEPLLAAGGTLSALDTQGKTPLHEAAAAGQAAVLEALSLLPPSVSGPVQDTVRLPSKDGLTPLHMACKRGSEPTVLQLLKMGADPRVLDGTGRSLAHELCSRGDSAAGALSAVLAAGAGAGVATPTGITPLHEAAKDNAHAMAAMLLEAGASADVQRSDNGRAPLHTAAEYGSLEVLRLVLDACSDPNVLDLHQRTALHLALERQHSSIVDVLLDDARVDLTLATREGLTPLDMALQRQGGLDKAVVAKCAKKSKMARKRLRSSMVAVLAQGRNRTYTGGSVVSADARSHSIGASQASPNSPTSGVFGAPNSPVGLLASGSDREGSPVGVEASPADSAPSQLRSATPKGETDGEHAKLAFPRSCSDCGHLAYAFFCSTALDVDLYGAQGCLPERYQRYLAVVVQLYEGVQHFVAFVSSVQLLFEYAEEGTDSFSFIAAVLLLLLVISTDVVTVYGISHLAYDTAELIMRMLMSLTGLFPLALALGMESLGKDESRLFAQFLAVEGFGAALPQLLLLSGFIMAQASENNGVLPTSSALWLGVAVNILSAAAEITSTRLVDVSSPTVPGLLEDILMRSKAWQSLLFAAFFFLTALEATAAVILYGIFGQAFGAVVAVLFIVPVLFILCYAAWRLRVHKKVRVQHAYTDGTSLPVALLYYSVMSIVSGAGVVHGYGNARSDSERQKMLALNNSKVGTSHFDTIFMSVYFRAGVFVAVTCTMAVTLLASCPESEALCQLPDWQVAIYLCIGLIIFIQLIFISLLLLQRSQLKAQGPTTHPTCTAARQADMERRARLGLGTATRQMNIARSGGTTPILPSRAFLSEGSSPASSAGQGGDSRGAFAFSALDKHKATVHADVETGTPTIIDDSATGEHKPRATPLAPPPILNKAKPKPPPPQRERGASPPPDSKDNKAPDSATPNGTSTPQPADASPVARGEGGASVTSGGSRPGSRQRGDKGKQTRGRARGGKRGRGR